MPLKLCPVLLAVALSAALVPSAALAQPVPMPLPPPIERIIEPRAVAPTNLPTMRLDEAEEEAAYPGYYGWRTYPSTHYGFGVARPASAGQPFYGFGYRPVGYVGIYRPFYYRHGFYFRGRPFGYVPYGDAAYGIGCGDDDD